MEIKPDEIRRFFEIVDEPILVISKETGISRQSLYNIKKGKSDIDRINLQTAEALQKYINRYPVRN